MFGHSLLLQERNTTVVAKRNVNDNMFDGFYQSVHVDEKWFFLTEERLTLYIATDEEAPNRFIQNKDHITKVMFLCAIARPWYNDNNECLFDRKIGMWPIVKYGEAQRRSQNRARDVIITKPVKCERDKYRELMIEKVLPAIKENWPDCE